MYLTPPKVLYVIFSINKVETKIVVNLHSLLCIHTHILQVRLVDVISNGLSFTRGLDKQEGRVLSVAWHPGGDFVAVGGADSIIRKLDVRTGHCVLRITMDEYKSRNTLVWDIKFLSDLTIVSADSLGKVQFWNSSQGTLVQSCPLHNADVLALAVSEDGTAVYSAGIDKRVICLKKVANERKWLKSGYVRVHTHDVRALALSRTGLLASGGVDTQLVTCPTNTFDFRTAIKYHPTPDSSRFFSVAPSANVLMHQGNLSLCFWQLSTQHCIKSEASSTEALPTTNGGRLSHDLLSPSTSLSSVGEVRVCEGVPAPLPHCTNGVPKNFLEIKCKGPPHILCSAVSADSVNVALSTVDQVWVYHIEHTKLSVQCVKEAQCPCFKMAFTPCGQNLVLATINNGVKTVNTSTLDFDNARTLNAKSKSKHLIINFEISSDSKLVALSSSSRRISVCSLETGEVLCKVPRMDSQPTLFTFNMSCDQLILYTGAERQLYSFHITDKHLEIIGRVTLNRKYEGRSQLTYPNGLIPVPRKRELYAVYDSDCVVLVRGPRDSEKSGSQEETSKGKRKERSFEGDPLRLRFVSASSGVVLFTGPFGGGELVLVERSWTETLSRLPPALARTQYGT